MEQIFRTIEFKKIIRNKFKKLKETKKKLTFQNNKKSSLIQFFYKVKIRSKTIKFENFKLKVLEQNSVRDFKL